MSECKSGFLCVDWALCKTSKSVRQGNTQVSGYSEKKEQSDILQTNLKPFHSVFDYRHSAISVRSSRKFILKLLVCGGPIKM